MRMRVRGPASSPPRSRWPMERVLCWWARCTLPRLAPVGAACCDGRARLHRGCDDWLPLPDASADQSRDRDIMPLSLRAKRSNLHPGGDCFIAPLLAMTVAALHVARQV